MSYKVTGTTIELTRGDSFWGAVSLFRNNDTPYVPDDGDVIRFVLKRNLMDALKSKYVDTKPLIEKVIPHNTMVLYLEPSDTKHLPFGDYVYDIELNFSDGNVDTFINNATFHLLSEVD